MKVIRTKNQQGNSNFYSYNINRGNCMFLSYLRAGDFLARDVVLVTSRGIVMTSRGIVMTSCHYEFNIVTLPGLQNSQIVSSHLIPLFLTVKLMRSHDRAFLLTVKCVTSFKPRSDRITLLRPVPRVSHDSKLQRSVEPTDHQTWLKCVLCAGWFAKRAPVHVISRWRHTVVMTSLKVWVGLRRLLRMIFVWQLFIK